MTRYAMTTKGCDGISWWDECRANTLLGAKREASRVMGHGFLAHTICVGEVLAYDAGGKLLDVCVVSSRAMHQGAKWNDVK